MPSVNLGRVSIVPKGAWSNSNSYEKLDVVTYGGGSYIANKDVPAGTSLTTTEYWSNFVGSFNIGTVETVSASTGASAELITTSTGQTLNLQIPRGVAGNESIDDTAGIGDTDYVWSADKTQTEINNLQNNIEGKANAIEKTVSGDIVSFDDGADNQCVKSLKVNIEPVQDLHGYDAPWPAGGNVNQLLLSTTTIDTEQNGIHLVYSPDTEKIKITGTNTKTNSAWLIVNTPFTNNISTTTGEKWYLHNLMPTGMYTQLSYNKTDSSIGSLVNLSGDGTFHYVPVTIPENFASFANIQIGVYASSTTSISTDNCVIGLLSTTTDTWTPCRNICPITGWDEVEITRTKKNIIPLVPKDSITSNGVTFTFGTSQATISGTSISEYPQAYYLQDWMLKAGTYTFSKNIIGTIPTGGLLYAYLRDNNNNNIVGLTSVNSRTFTLNEDTKIKVLVVAQGNNLTWNNVIIKLQLEFGSTATPHQPYNGTTTTINLNGTRYDGTVDVTNGKMTVTHGYVDLGTLTWGMNGQGSFVYESSSFDGANDPSGNNLLCSMYVGGNAYDGPKDKCICIRIGSYKRIWVRDNDYSDSTTFKTAMSGVQLVYELAQPFEVTLTPQQLSTLLGENHIWADAGDIEITYRTEIPALEWGNISGDLSDQTDLKSALDSKENVSEVTAITGCEVIRFDAGKYYLTDGSTVDITAPMASTEYESAVVACSIGDVFYVTGQGGFSPRLWCFIDSSGNVLSVATASLTGNKIKITAPTNSAYLVVNVHNNVTRYLTKGALLIDTVNGLQSEINALPNVIYVPYTTTQGKYINANGVETAYDGWSISEYLKINKVATYYLKTAMPSDNVKAAFYDKNKQLISVFKPLQGSNILSAVENAEYVRFSIQTTDINDFTYTSNIFMLDRDGVIKPNHIDEIETVETFKNHLINGSYYKETGEIATNTNWARTPLYSVNEGDEVIITNAYYTCAVCFDSNQDFVSAVSVGGTLSTIQFTVSSGVSYIGFNAVIANLSGYTITINRLIPDSKYSVPWLVADAISIWQNKTYISHGDSITWRDGTTWGEGPDQGKIARGYQTIFSEAVGLASYNNQGKSGWSMAVVNGDGIVNTIMAIADYTVYDLCTIACGTNDFKLNVPLGTLGIIGDTTFDDSTFYGAYRKAVEYILTNSPTIRLVLMTPLQRDNAGYDVNYTNSAGCKLIDYVEAIRKIGEMYGLPVCDMYANSGYTKKTLATYTLDGLHPNSVGYVRMGNYLTGFLNAVGN